MNTRILLISFLAAAALAAAATPARAGSYVVVGCSDLGTQALRPPTAGTSPPAATRRAMTAGRAAASTRPAAARPNLFRFDAPAGTTISRLVTAYRAHLSAAGPWAVPTLVAEAGHAGEWESIPPARGYIGGVPIELGAARVEGAAHAADALRIGVRCDRVGPCVAGGAAVGALLLARASSSATTTRRPSALARRAATCARRSRSSVAARDEGGGVFERALDLDGRRLAAAHLCATVPSTIGRAAPRDSRVPCPLDAPATVPLDTRTRRRRRAHAGRAGRGRRRQRPHRERAHRRRQPPAAAGHGHARRRPVGGADRAAERLQRRGHDLRVPLGALRRRRLHRDRRRRLADLRRPPARRGPPPPRGRHRHRRRRQRPRRLPAERADPGARRRPASGAAQPAT